MPHFASRFAFLFSTFALGLGATAQNCQLTDLKKNTVLEMTSYDAKNRVTGRSLQTVTAVTTNGPVSTATFHQQQFDAKSKPTMEGDFTLECSGNMMRFDMRASMGQQEQSMRAMENMDLEIQSDHLDIPLGAQAGEKLPDGVLTMRAADKTSQMVMMSMRMNATDRVVEAREAVTTPAGTFQCLKVRQLLKMENTAMGIPMRFEMASVSWYAPGVGQVRSESYRKDKLVGSTVLTKLSK